MQKFFSRIVHELKADRAGNDLKEKMQKIRAQSAATKEFLMCPPLFCGASLGEMTRGMLGLGLKAKIVATQDFGLEIETICLIAGYVIFFNDCL